MWGVDVEGQGGRDCRLCGVPIRVRRRNELSLDKLEHSDRTIEIYTINMEFLYWAWRYDWYRDVLSRGSTTADGKWVQKIANLKCKEGIEHIPGSSLLPDMLREASERGWRVAFIGDTGEVHERLREKIARDYPGVEPFFYDPGSISLEDLLKNNNEVIDKIKNKILEFRPKLVFFAFGPPKQELLIDKLSKTLEDAGVVAAVGVGGSFRMLAGLEKRAPNLIRRMGLEWLWRLIQNPRRISKVARSIVGLLCAILR